MSEVLVAGKRIRVQPSQSIGKGGEADVYDIGGGVALKIFKAPSHPDLQGFPDDQRAAAERLRIAQRKLREFPRNLPSVVVAPVDLASDRNGKVVGYTMRLVADAEPLARLAEPAYAGPRDIPGLFLGLHEAVEALHQAGIVIGDFNDLNVLVTEARPHLIDADSYQFGPYLCGVYTDRFVDPVLCGPTGALARPYSTQSDWYAYAVLLLQSLLHVGPYGGVYRPLPPTERRARRITIFHPDVIYPKPAVPYRSLPSELLAYFRDVFERDRREPFPRRLLGARPAAVAAVPLPAFRGRVVATSLYTTTGTILRIAPGAWLVHEDGEFRREDGSVVARGPVRPGHRYRFSGRRTFIGSDGFDANDRGKYWIRDGQLWAEHGYIGDVLAGQTRFWVGPEFGLGFYRAGNLNVGFVFDAAHRGIRDDLKLPIAGRLLDATCRFGAGRGWLFLRLEISGCVVHRCVLVRRDGTIEGVAEAPKDDGSWLGTLRAKCVAGPYLFAATDAGIVRIDGLAVSREFPDTEPFVDSACMLAADPRGLMVARGPEIFLLSIS